LPRVLVSIEVSISYKILFGKGLATAEKKGGANRLQITLTDGIVRRFQEIGPG
jgi:hypothetical protein